MSKTIVLTGASGFLGAGVCRALVSRGHHVHAYRRPASNLCRVHDIAESVEWHCLPGGLETPFRSTAPPNAVVHCATAYGRKAEMTTDLIETNVSFPVQLLELAQSAGVRDFLNSDTALPPETSAYALSKHQAVQWLKTKAVDTRVTNLKLQQIYGPGDDAQKFITSICQQCAANIPEIHLTHGSQQRDFIYIDDVVDAFCVVLVDAARDAAIKGGFGEIEVGSGQAFEVRAVVEQIHRLTNSRSKLLFGALPMRPGEPMHLRADITALQAMGWQPKIPLDSGLRRTLEVTKCLKL